MPVRITDLKPDPFVSWFRSVAPYVQAHQGRTFVIGFGGELVRDMQFDALANDLKLLASLGVRLVLVHGARPQIDAQLVRLGLQARFSAGLRITDSDTLHAVLQAVGGLRAELEAKLSMALPNTPMAGASLRLTGGNLVVAKPIGVIEGVDFLHTGTVRRVDADSIRRLLDLGMVVLLSPIGYSPTGETFNLAQEDVAASVATALNADKLVFLGDTRGLGSGRAARLRELSAVQAEALLASTRKISAELKHYLECALRVTRMGVARMHLVDRAADGSLLRELFTHSGVGSMVTRDALETLREARIEDVSGILRLIEPLEADGTLVRRGRELLEMEIDRFCVLEHDRSILGCAALYGYPDHAMAELACLAVDPAQQNSGYGERLLSYIEQRARARGIVELFVLTTRTAHWFVEHGFSEAPVGRLPGKRQSLYNYQRRSKVFFKTLA